MSVPPCPADDRRPAKKNYRKSGVDNVDVQQLQCSQSDFEEANQRSVMSMPTCPEN